MTSDSDLRELYAKVKELARNTPITFITAKQVQSPYQRPWVGEPRVPADGPEIVIIDYLSPLTPN